MSNTNLYSGDYGLGRQKVKVVEKPEIVVRGTKEKPYFEVMYKEVGKDDYTLGYSSYDLNFVFQWLEEELEIVEEKNE